MEYKKITTLEKIGYHLGESVIFKSYMILGGWALFTIFVWVLLAIVANTQNDIIWLISFVFHSTLGFGVVHYHEECQNKKEHNQRIAEESQMNLFRDFGLTK